MSEGSLKMLLAAVHDTRATGKSHGRPCLFQDASLASRHKMLPLQSYQATSETRHMWIDQAKKPT